MSKLTFKCPTCDKQLKLDHEYRLGDSILYEYTCGHVFSKQLHTYSNLDFNAVDGSGKHARPYQEQGVQFILESDFNAILADQMRLGKTPQGYLALKNAYKDRTPCLIICKASNLFQLTREYKVWVDTLPLGIFPIVGSAAFIPPGFSAYIISMDTFARPKVLEQLKKIKFKLIIADEAHSFKNTDSNRAQALIDFVAFQNTGESDHTLEFKCVRCSNKWQEQGKQKYDKRIGHSVISKSSKCPKCGQYCYIQQQHDEKDKWQGSPEAVAKINKLLALGSESNPNENERTLALTKATELKVQYNVQLASDSKPCGLLLLTGTPILNRAEEYFVPLNLVAPEKFSSLEGFRRRWLEQDSKGRWSRVKHYYQDSFKETIKPYILRREKEDVYTDLPPLNRIYTMIEPDKELYAKQYNKILDKLESKLVEKANPTYWDMADDLMELRRICGMMKLSWAGDYLETCAQDSTAKYAIGIHHESVRDVLYTMLGGSLNCHKYFGGTSLDEKNRIELNWAKDNKQFLIINMIAGGVGLDLHYCDNVLILERGWNAEMERQFEFRFYNPDKSIKKNATTVEYVLSKGTFEEWWYNMIEEKSRNVDPLVYNNWDLQKDAISFKQLAEMTVAGRL